MAILSVGHLAYFPVQYYRFMIAAGIEPDNTKRIGRTTCESIITFGNSFDAPRNRGRSRHDAIDIFGAFGLQIVAATSGVVVEQWRTFGTSAGAHSGVGTNPRGGDGGYYVMIQDDRGLHHYYAHMMDLPAVAPGQTIRAGQLLGYLGDTGRSRGTCQHLHYQVSRRDPGLRFFNPYPELLRLAQAMGAIRRGHSTTYQIPVA